MSENRAVLSVEVESSKAESGAQKAVKSIDSIKMAAAESSSSMGKASEQAKGLGEALGGTGEKADRTRGKKEKLNRTLWESVKGTLEARQGYNRLENVLTDVGISAAGVTGRMGNVLDKLGEFAIGGPAALAVAGGIGALVVLYLKLTEANRKAEQQILDLIEVGKKLQEAFKESDPGERLSKTITQQEALNKAITKQVDLVAKLKAAPAQRIETA